MRIDFMYDAASTDELYITEINTIPGSLAFYLWSESGLSYAELIDRMVAFAYEKAHEDKNDSNYAFSSDILKEASFGAKAGRKIRRQSRCKGDCNWIFPRSKIRRIYST